ncbi:hypothetical protein QNI16_15210 [Cytophagaceae bacterium YF14B1]|uniref:Uncharacterized protein n=1 Tax=Xanthocytophaga flava TaxID=3048013 RepID=A0AAE3U942_9BACT|nr:hypothetical protein [Xanthocytophaga flavus]MDJ1481848.1 hypothetical protein [Xanthocytophaga flavus]
MTQSPHSNFIDMQFVTSLESSTQTLTNDEVLEGIKAYLQAETAEVNQNGNDFHIIPQPNHFLGSFHSTVIKLITNDTEKQIALTTHPSPWIFLGFGICIWLFFIEKYSSCYLLGAMILIQCFISGYKLFTIFEGLQEVIEKKAHDKETTIQ